MATVLRTGKQPMAVKNLGWLLRHWKQVESLGFNYSPSNMNDGELVARLCGGTTYITRYASLSVAWQFLNRPVFRTLPFELAIFAEGGRRKAFTVGDAQWTAIGKQPYAEQMAAILAP